MQAGFAMLEAGIVQPKNSTNILFKNMIDASMAAMAFWLLGYGIAYGVDDGQGFIGTKEQFAIGLDKAGINNTNQGWEGWFFQWAFAGAAATIVAGSVCERTKIEAYFVYSIILTAFIYPVVVHWGWGSGFLSAWGANTGPLFSKKAGESTGMIDFAGSGIVHMVGGVSGLMGAIVVGPRKGRFVNGEVVELFEGNKILQSLGTFILWFGWYGFNCGSTLMISQDTGGLAGKVAVTTTIAAAAGAIVATFLSKMITGTYDISLGLNGVLAGLVSITANCSVVDPWHAIFIGAIGAIFLFIGHYALFKLKIDDPCDACVVHGLCGFWGLLATGIFCTDANVNYAAYPNSYTNAAGETVINDACKSAEQFGVQIVGGLAIFAWTAATAGLTFVVVNLTIGMRVSDEIEDMGLDASEHGAPADFTAGGYKSSEAPKPAPPVQGGMVYATGMPPMYPMMGAPMQPMPYA